MNLAWRKLWLECDAGRDFEVLMTEDFAVDDSVSMLVS